MFGGLSRGRRSEPIHRLMSGGRNALALVRHGKEFTHYINRKMLSVEITPNHAPRQGDGTLILNMHRRAIG